MFFVYKQKTAYEMRISDWSSDVCSSDLVAGTASMLVSQEGEGRVQLLAESTQHLWVVELVVLQELHRVSVQLDVDLSDGVVGGSLGVALGDANLQPWLQQSQSVPALDLLHEVLHWAGLDGVQKVADEILIAVQVKELANDLRSLLWGDLGAVHLNVLHEVVRVQVGGHLVHEVVAIAHVNEWARIGEL